MPFKRLQLHAADETCATAHTDGDGVFHQPTVDVFGAEQAALWQHHKQQVRVAAVLST